MRYIVLLMLLMTGCATAQTTAGLTEQGLIDKRGLPDQQATTPTGKIFQYRSCKAVYDQIYCHRMMYYIENGMVVKVEKKRG